YKRHRKAIPISIPDSTRYPARQYSVLRKTQVMPEIQFCSDILRIGSVEYLFLLSVNHIGAGNNTQQVGRQIQVRVKIKIVFPLVGAVLRVQVVVVHRPDNKLPLEASGQDDIGIQRLLKRRTDMSRVYIVDTHNIKGMLFLCTLLPHISETCFKGIQRVLIFPVKIFVPQIYSGLRHKPTVGSKLKRSRNAREI